MRPCVQTSAVSVSFRFSLVCDTIESITNMSLVLTVVAGAITLYLLVVYTVVRGGRCTSSVNMTGKTAIVTGSNCGIGKATALGLARRGARVILACRHQGPAEAAAYDIRRESGNNKVVFMQLDLGSLKSVRAFVETFLKTEPRLDLLINNAGVMGSGRTEDGFGLTFGVNHLGHFLLTNLLLERLQRCSPSRVVTVSAALHRLGAVDCALLPTEGDVARSSRPAWLHAFRSYCSSKLCNLLFTRELANRLEGTGVSCYSLHPGVVNTALTRNMHVWQRILLMPVAKLFFLDAEAGSQTTLHCALQTGIEPLSGRYFSCCRPQQVGARGRDDGLARKLWEVSERLTS